jgi:hypothetical protein
MNLQTIQIGYYEITDMMYEKKKDENTFKNFILTEDRKPIPISMFDMIPLVDDDDNELIFGLYLRDNKLTKKKLNEFLPFPINLVEIDIENTNFSFLPHLPNYLQGLNVRNNYFKKLPHLPDYLQRLNIEKNNFTFLPPLPSNLQRLNIRNNYFEKLPKLTCYPNRDFYSITHLYCDNNQLTELPKLDKFRYLEELNCSNNFITKIPDLPSNLINLHCANNSLESLPIFPESLRVLSCRGNEFKEETVSRIIEFYEKAIKNNYTMTNPSFQEELNYFNTNRSIAADIVLRTKSLPVEIREKIRTLAKLKGGKKTFLKKKTIKKKGKQIKNKQKKKTMKKRQRI